MDAEQRNLIGALIILRKNRKAHTNHAVIYTHSVIVPASGFIQIDVIAIKMALSVFGAKHVPAKVLCN